MRPGFFVYTHKQQRRKPLPPPAPQKFSRCGRLFSRYARCFWSVLCTFFFALRTRGCFWSSKCTEVLSYFIASRQIVQQKAAPLRTVAPGRISSLVNSRNGPGLQQFTYLPSPYYFRSTKAASPVTCSSFYPPSDTTLAVAAPFVSMAISRELSP